MPTFLKNPLIAILRGLEPTKAIETASILYEEGFKILEVPLNSPNPLTSIKAIKDHFKDKMIIGAGTVLTADDVDAVARAGGQIILSPDCNIDVVRQSKKRGLYSFPGIATPTEAFTALRNGADGLKLFPCDLLRPSIIKAYKAVLPKDVILLGVGGIDADNMNEFTKVGVNGFGLGSSLFKPSMSNNEIRHAAQKAIKSFNLI